MYCFRAESGEEAYAKALAESDQDMYWDEASGTWVSRQ